MPNKGCRLSKVVMGQRIAKLEEKYLSPEWLKCFLLIVTSGIFSPSLVQASTFDCLIEPTQTVELASPVTGLLDKVNVKRGDRIAKGQVLAVLSRAQNKLLQNWHVTSRSKRGQLKQR